MSGTDSIEKEINMLRVMSYIFNILSYLQDEPLCSRCDSFAKSIETAKKRFLSLEKSVNKNRAAHGDIRRLFLNIYTLKIANMDTQAHSYKITIDTVLAGLTIPDNTLKQDETGNCTMPSGFCLATSALRLYEDIEKLTHNKEVLIR